MKKKNKEKKKHFSMEERKKEKIQRKKEIFMQDYFPFQSIEEGLITMENGDLRLFFKIQANNLDLLSVRDLNRMIHTYSKDTDRCKYKISYFIQDSVFNLHQNVLNIETARSKQNNSFLRMLLDENKEMLLGKESSSIKKKFYLRVHINAKDKKHINIEEIKSRMKHTFTTSLDLVEASKNELKQMLAIYGNRIFSENIPDSEYKEDKVAIKKLLKKEVETYQSQQLPGIYEFKDMIVPITTQINPSSIKLGRNFVKTYAVSSFLGSTSETNLLSKVCSLAGVTTSIYIESLAINKFKSSLKLDLKSKKSEVNDEVDDIDAETEKKSLKGSYKRVREENQKMYYISVFFQLSAKTKREFDDLEEIFFSEIDDKDITLDDLKTMQNLGFQSVNPIGENKLEKWVKQNVPSESFANLYPFNEPSLLDPNGLPIGNIVGKTNQVIFDPFAMRGSNHNILILGYSGKGKTVLLMLLLSNIAAMNGYVRNIDFEGLQKDFIERLGGINIDISGGNEFCINPLQIREPDEISSGVVNDYISEVRKWIAVYKPKWSDEILDLFQHFLTRTYEEKGINNLTDLKALKNTDYPILEDVYNLIIDEKDNFKNEESLAEFNDLKGLILGLDAAVNGADAAMFNRHTSLGNKFNDTKVINFDMSGLMNSDKARKLAQWANIFTYISQFVNANMDRTKKIAVSIDEMHECLKLEFLPIVSIISDYERRFRKYLATFIKSTQTIDEVDSKNSFLESLVKPLFSQSKTKFLFHLGDIDYEKPQRLMSLTNTEINKLKEDRNGQCLLRVNNALYDLQVFMPEWFKEVKKDA